MNLMKWNNLRSIIFNVSVTIIQEGGSLPPAYGLPAPPSTGALPP
jgi:hypothetical protein